MELQKLVVRIGADLSELNSKLDQAGRSIGAAAQKMGAAGSMLSKGVTLPLAAVGAGLFAATTKAAAFADQIDKTAIRTGLSRGALQELHFVTDQLGVSFEAVQNSVGAFTRAIPQIESGTGDTAEAFQRLGVQLRGADGQIRSMSQLYPEMVRSLANMSDEVERNALATKVFGRGAQELVPLLAAGGDKIDELTRRARELGLVMDDAAVGGLVDFKDQMAALQASASAAGRGIAIALLPILRDQLIPFVQDRVIPAIRGFAEWLGSLDPRAVQVGFAVVGLAAALGPLLVIVSKVTLAVIALHAALNPFVALAAVVGIALGGMVTWYLKAERGADSAAKAADRYRAALQSQSETAVMAATAQEMALQDTLRQRIAENKAIAPFWDSSELDRQIVASELRIRSLAQRFNELKAAATSAFSTSGGGGGGGNDAGVGGRLPEAFEDIAVVVDDVTLVFANYLTELKDVVGSVGAQATATDGATAALDNLGDSALSVQGALNSFTNKLAGGFMSSTGLSLNPMAIADKVIGGFMDFGFEMLRERSKRPAKALEQLAVAADRVNRSLSNVPLSYNVDLARHRINSANSTTIGTVVFQVDSASTWDGIKRQMSTAASRGDPVARRLVLQTAPAS
jgi:hypothetical protein